MDSGGAADHDHIHRPVCEKATEVVIRAPAVLPCKRCDLLGIASVNFGDLYSRYRKSSADGSLRYIAAASEAHRNHAIKTAPPPCAAGLSSPPYFVASIPLMYPHHASGSQGSSRGGSRTASTRGIGRPSRWIRAPSPPTRDRCRQLS